MKLFSKSKNTEGDSAAVGQTMGDAQERVDLFLKCIQALFLFVREYTLDISEIDADRFKEQLDALQSKVDYMAFYRRNFNNVALATL